MPKKPAAAAAEAVYDIAARPVGPGRVPGRVGGKQWGEFMFMFHIKCFAVALHPFDLLFHEYQRLCCPV